MNGIKWAYILHSSCSKPELLGLGYSRHVKGDSRPLDRGTQKILGDAQSTFVKQNGI